MRRLKHLRTYEVSLNKAGLGPVAGVDEAGRGACAGPIVIAACILPDYPISELASVTDSKLLTASRRAQLFPLIQKHALSWSIVSFTSVEIDRYGLQYANIGGMRRAIAGLGVSPGFVLIDGFSVPGLSCPSLPIIGGDRSARCIAAASVLAKHYRDALMTDLAVTYPEYGFESHKGYGTKTHLAAVRRHGASSVHRYSYSNVAAAHEEWLRSKSNERGSRSER